MESISGHAATCHDLATEVVSKFANVTELNCQITEEFVKAKHNTQNADVQLVQEALKEGIVVCLFCPLFSTLSSPPFSSPSPAPHPDPSPDPAPAPALAPGFPTSFTAPRTLSVTEWTRDHWLRLEALADLRCADKARFRGVYFPSSGYRRASSESEEWEDGEDGEREADLDLDRRFAAHPLRGKEVVAQGACLVLQPWHLEVVEAFRRDLGGGSGGWDDAVLAKRLFALLVGRERRAALRARRGDRG